MISKKNIDTGPTLHYQMDSIDFSVFGRKDLEGLPFPEKEEDRRTLEREFLGEYFNLSPKNVVFLKQVHGKTVHYVDRPGGQELYYGEGDALFTDVPGILLVVRTADCVPFFFGCRCEEKKIAGIVHAGWRGLSNGIIPEALEKADVESCNCLSFTGPAIGIDAYEVGPEVAENFTLKRTGKGDRFHLDLIGEARKQAYSGRDPEVSFDACTYSKNELFYSHRRGDRERNLNTVLIRSSGAKK